MKYPNRDELIAKAKELHEEGVSLRKIAKRLGVAAPSTVSHWVNPKKTNNFGPVEHKDRDKLISRAIELRKEGLSYQKAADLLGINDGNTLQRWLNPEAHKQYAKTYYKKNIEDISIKHNIYNQVHKEEIKVRLDSLPDDVKERDRVRRGTYYKSYYLEHKKEESARQKIYYAENREATLIRGHEYYRNHKEESSENSRRRRANMHTPEKIDKDQYGAIFDEQGGLCFYCGEPMLRDGDQYDQSYYHIEHINPVSNGGFHELSNIVYACAKCNHSKYTELVEDWMPEILPKIAANPRLRYDIEEAHMRWLV